MDKSSNHKGNAWTSDEVRALIELFNAGLDVFRIAETHGRTPNAIVSKLEKLGYLTAIGRGYRKVEPTDWVTFDELKQKQHFNE